MNIAVDAPVAEKFDRVTGTAESAVLSVLGIHSSISRVSIGWPNGGIPKFRSRECRNHSSSRRQYSESDEFVIDLFVMEKRPISHLSRIV